MSVTMRVQCDSCNVVQDGLATPPRWSRLCFEYYVASKQTTHSRELHLCPECLNRRFAGMVVVDG